MATATSSVGDSAEIAAEVETPEVIAETETTSSPVETAPEAVEIAPEASVSEATETVEAAAPEAAE